MCRYEALITSSSAHVFTRDSVPRGWCAHAAWSLRRLSIYPVTHSPCTSAHIHDSLLLLPSFAHPCILIPSIDLRNSTCTTHGIDPMLDVNALTCGRRVRSANLYRDLDPRHVDEVESASGGRAAGQFRSVNTPRAIFFFVNYLMMLFNKNAYLLDMFSRHHITISVRNSHRFAYLSVSRVFHPVLIFHFVFCDACIAIALNIY